MFGLPAGGKIARAGLVTGAALRERCSWPALLGSETASAVWRSVAVRVDTDRVSGAEETNVRLPACAFDALGVFAARQGTSRDAAVRQVLCEHVGLFAQVAWVFGKFGGAAARAGVTAGVAVACRT
jgi:hypothetical protein